VVAFLERAAADPAVVAIKMTVYRIGDDTPFVRSLIRAAEIGQRSGLRYVYAGNLPGLVGPYEHTFCPGCQTAVVQRVGYRILAVSLADGACKNCGTKIPGVWT